MYDLVLDAAGKDVPASFLAKSGKLFYWVVKRPNLCKEANEVQEFQGQM